MEYKNLYTDPRILRTRQLLKDALIDLLQQMDIEKISVNLLAERATINRVTFYLHYKDIPDMLKKMADDMTEEISKVLNKQSSDQELTKQFDRQGMECFLEYIAENAKFYKIVLGSKQVPIFRDCLLTFFTELIVKRLEKRGNASIIEEVGVKKDILIWYDSAALIGTISAWLQNDMPYTPSFMANQLSLLHH